MSTTEIARYLSISQPRLRAYIAGIVFNWADVDDILQDVAITAVEKAESFDSDRSIDAWMFGIARMKVLKYLETHKRQRLRFSDTAVQLLAEDFQSEPDQHDLSGELKDCLSGLDENEQKIIALRHRDEMNNRNLAKELGYSESKTSRLVSGLYQRLMRCLERKRDLAGNAG